MVIFLKPNSVISEKLFFFYQEQLHYEAKLYFLFENGKFVAVTFGLDITKRKYQSKQKSKGLPWEHAKVFDGSALFSQFVKITSISQNLNFELDINGKKVQTGTNDMKVHKPNEILEELKTFMSLNNGDIIMISTQKGVGVVNKGNVFIGNVMDDDEVTTSLEWLVE